MSNSDDEKKDCTAGDELIAGPELPGGARPFIRHTADHQTVAGVMTPVKEGEQLYPGAFTLEHKEGNRYTVEDVFNTAPKAAPEEGHKGPAKVNSKAFRNNWDGIFGKKTVGEA